MQHLYNTSRLDQGLISMKSRFLLQFSSHTLFSSSLIWQLCLMFTLNEAAAKILSSYAAINRSHGLSLSQV